MYVGVVGIDGEIRKRYKDVGTEYDKNIYNSWHEDKLSQTNISLMDPKYHSIFKDELSFSKFASQQEMFRTVNDLQSNEIDKEEFRGKQILKINPSGKYELNDEKISLIDTDLHKSILEYLGFEGNDIGISRNDMYAFLFGKNVGVLGQLNDFVEEKTQFKSTKVESFIDPKELNAINSNADITTSKLGLKNRDQYNSLSSSNESQNDQVVENKDDEKTIFQNGSINSILLEEDNIRVDANDADKFELSPRQTLLSNSIIKSSANRDINAPEIILIEHNEGKSALKNPKEYVNKNSVNSSKNINQSVLDVNKSKGVFLSFNGDEENQESIFNIGSNSKKALNTPSFNHESTKRHLGQISIYLKKYLKKSNNHSIEEISQEMSIVSEKIEETNISKNDNKTSSSFQEEGSGKLKVS